MLMIPASARRPLASWSHCSCLLLLATVATFWTGPRAGAQSPAANTPKPTATPLRLEPLPLALGGDVYVQHNLQSGARRADAGGLPQDPAPRPVGQGNEGSTAVSRFAAIRDARFEHDGRLAALLVAAPVADPRAEAVVRSLPAAQVHWDDTKRQWFVNEAHLKLVELEAAHVERPGVTPPANPRPAAPAWLASQIVQATFDPALFAAPPATPAVPGAGTPTTTNAPGTAPVGTYWLAPKLQRLVLVVAPVPVVTAAGVASTRLVAVPWALVRLATTPGGLRLHVAASPTALASGPACADANAEPDAALRHLGYAHFQTSVPSWEPARAGAAAR